MLCYQAGPKLLGQGQEILPPQPPALLVLLYARLHLAPPQPLCDRDPGDRMTELVSLAWTNAVKAEVCRWTLLALPTRHPLMKTVPPMSSTRAVLSCQPGGLPHLSHAKVEGTVLSSSEAL